MRTDVVATFALEGFHRWPDAPEPVAFLAERHRHLFHFRLELATSFDRQQEFILLGRAAADFLRAIYGEPCEFGTLSCEAIAENLLTRFGLSRCEVFEDGENGAVVTA